MTETAVMYDAKAALAALQDLANLGAVASGAHTGREEIRRLEAWAAKARFATSGIRGQNAARVIAVLAARPLVSAEDVATGAGIIRMTAERMLDWMTEMGLPEGKLTALIGPNGAGKSTLLRLIGRLEPLQAGRIVVGGHDVAQCPTDCLARVMAILGQQTAIASRLRLAELVGFGRWPHHQGRPSGDDHARVAEALEAFALTPLAGRFLNEVSGGQA